MLKTAKIPVIQSEVFDRNARGGRSRNRRAMRSRKHSALVFGDPSGFRGSSLREMVSGVFGNVAVQQGNRTGVKKATPIIAYGRPSEFRLHGHMRTLVKPIAGKGTPFSRQPKYPSEPETVGERGSHSTSETAGDSAPLVEPTDGTVPAVQEQDDFDTVLRKLEQAHLTTVANRIRYLQDEIDEEEGEEPVNGESLRRFTDFVLMDQPAGSPSTWIDHRGFLGLEWRIPDPARTDRISDANTEYWGKGDGILAMVFLPTGLIRFSGTSGPVGQGIERLKVSGTYPPSGVMEAVQPFLSRVESQW